MNKTLIEWAKNPDGTQGYTWNPITGCLNGCPYCYARKLANGRLKQRYLANTNYLIPRENIGLLFRTSFEGAYDPFYPRFWPERLNEDLGICRGVFVCDMSDLFGNSIPEEWTREVLDRITRSSHRNRYYLLTKQPQNLIKFSPFPDNCWVGVTATDAQSFFSAGRRLEQVKAKIKYISFEPLLGYVGGLWLEDWLKSGVGINWLIIGAQTKPAVYPRIEWVKEIVEAADGAGIPVFLKDNLKPLFENLSDPDLACYMNLWERSGKVLYAKQPRQEMPMKTINLPIPVVGQVADKVSQKEVTQ